MESLDVPDWDFPSSSSALYPSLEASGKIKARHGKRDEERLLQKLIQGTVRLNGVSKKSNEASGQDPIADTRVQKVSQSGALEKKDKKRKRDCAPQPGEAKQAGAKAQKSRRKRRPHNGTAASEPDPEGSSPAEAKAAQRSSAAPTEAIAGTDGDSQQPAAPIKKSKKSKRKENLQKERAELHVPREAEEQAAAAAQPDEPPKKKRSRNKFKPDGAPTVKLDCPSTGAATGQQECISKAEPQTEGAAGTRSEELRPTAAAVQGSGQAGASQAAVKQQKKADKALEGTTAPAQLQQDAAVSKGAPAKQRDGGLLEKMRAKLSGGRFRWLNEQLYTCPGDQALELMQGQPHLFQQYHEGFQQQTAKWPVQPVEVAVEYLRRQSKKAVVADFGCGDARLAALARQKVHSLDLVASAPGVIACNMAHTPLGTASVDIAVFCLALMGTDYPSFLEEAHRVLRPQGLLWIAEVRSRFGDGEGGNEDFRPFLKALEGLGFSKESMDTSNSHFVIFELQKAKPGSGTGALQWPSLKPCVYKRR